MNKRYLYIFLVAGLITAIQACRKDDSTLPLNKLPGVKIDTAGTNPVNVFQFDRLVIKPKLITTIPDNELSYSWRINLLPQDTVWQEIGTSKDLDAEIKLPPTAFGKYHLLYYTITHNTTGLNYIMSWDVMVRNNIGEGLVIAETKDNTNTDISHIMSPEVTLAFNKVSVKHHVYSSINGATLPGLVKQMRFTKIGADDVVFAITDNSILAYNTLTYNYRGANNDFFFTQSAQYQPRALGGLYQGDVYIADGKFTATYLGAAKKYGVPYDFKYVVPDKVALNGHSSGVTGSYDPPVKVNFYDETAGYFVYLPSINFGDTKMHDYPSVTGKPFDPHNVLNKKNLAAGISSDRGFLHLLKDKTTGKVELYIFDAGALASPSPVPPSPVALYDLAAAPDIDQATKFVLLDNQKVLYYATATKIYAVLFSTSSPVFEERYTVPAGEQITTLQIYQQVGYPMPGTYLPTSNNQLIMSTYGTEGKVYLLPMINLGLGNIDVPNIKTFSGFDKITAITPQK